MATRWDMCGIWRCQCHHLLSDMQNRYCRVQSSPLHAATTLNVIFHTRLWRPSVCQICDHHLLLEADFSLLTSGAPAESHLGRVEDF